MFSSYNNDGDLIFFSLIADGISGLNIVQLTLPENLVTVNNYELSDVVSSLSFMKNDIK